VALIDAGWQVLASLTCIAQAQHPSSTIRFSNPDSQSKLEMMTKRELEQELSKTKKELKHARALLMRAAANVETMMALQDECQRLKAQVRQSRNRKSN